ncbi:heavy-metal-associated domain-containing protein [Martelella mediterranea]|nr:hypothetical protein [Hoeflea sp.]MBA67250.1 hypothetical protein [Hyphomicrobiales bacterium]MCD1636702.1 heavy-metal-associated domain-containing protein [Martelella mediterranea]
MDCASCAQKIDTAVRRIEGIEEIAGSATAGTATVSQGAEVDLSLIKTRIESLGYKVSWKANSNQTGKSYGNTQQSVFGRDPPIRPRPAKLP